MRNQNDWIQYYTGGSGGHLNLFNIWWYDDICLRERLWPENSEVQIQRSEVFSTEKNESFRVQTGNAYPLAEKCV